VNSYWSCFFLFVKPSFYPLHLIRLLHKKNNEICRYHCKRLNPINTSTISIVGFRIRIQIFNDYDNNGKIKNLFNILRLVPIVLEVLKLNYLQLTGYLDRVRNSVERERERLASYTYNCWSWASLYIIIIIYVI